MAKDLKITQMWKASEINGAELIPVVLDKTNKTITTLLIIDKTKLTLDPTFNDIYEVLYNLHSIASLKVSPNIIEQGEPTTVEVTWSFKFNGVNTTPKKLIITGPDNGNYTDVSKTSFTESVSKTIDYNMTAEYESVKKTAYVSVKAYYPKYYGLSNKTELTGSDVIGFNKQPIKSGVYSETYSDNATNGLYVWLCVPESMSVDTVVSDKVAVPMENPVIVVVAGKGNYKCYRTASPLETGSFIFNID